MDLGDIIQPVKDDLRRFEKHFSRALRSEIGLADTIVRYLVKRKGKRIRPALVLLSAAACGSISESTFRGASLVELLHTATLIHDDVVDGAETRRGLASINAVWKNKVAVLIGDYVLARGLLLALNGNDFEYLRVVSEAVRRMSEGELLQIQKARRMNTDEETYFRIISDKTASLLSTCCEIGATGAGGNEDFRINMRNYGENLGVCFQIQDDILDFTGKEATTGKPVGGDLKEKKLTLPLIYAFSQAPGKTNRRILRMLKNGVGNEEIGQVYDFVREFGGIEYARRKAEEYRDKALQDLSPLPLSPGKESLANFTTFVMDRSR